MGIRSLLMMVVFAAGLVVSGCDASSESLNRQSRALVGQWTCHDGPITTTYEFCADGTCTKIVSVAAIGVSGETDRGTWRLADDCNLELSYSTEIAVPAEPDRIQLTDMQLVFADANHPMAFRRTQ